MIIHKNHYVLSKKSIVSLGKRERSCICKRCFYPYSNQDVLINQLQKCGQQGITSIKVSRKSHLYWEAHFHDNPLDLRIIADFEADNETDNSNIGNKTTNIY